MHDYLRGAYEALCWVQAMLREESRCRLPPNHPPISEGLNKVMREVEGALEDINLSVAAAFRSKLKQP